MTTSGMQSHFRHRKQSSQRHIGMYMGRAGRKWSESHWGLICGVVVHNGAMRSFQKS